MEGLERMTREITGRAGKEAQELLEKARQEAQALVAEAKREAAERLKEEGGRMDREEAEAAGRAASARALAGRRELLRVRQEIIADLIDKARRRLEERETEAYFDTLLQMLAEAAHPQEKGTMILSAGDLARLPADFEERVSRTAKEKGGTVELQREPGRAMHGFMLAYGGVEENCTFEALVQEKRDRLQDLANEMLWRESDGE